MKQFPLKHIALFSVLLCAQSYATITMQCRYKKSAKEFVEFFIPINNVGAISGDITAIVSLDWVKNNNQEAQEVGKLSFSKNHLVSYYIGEDNLTKAKEIQLEVINGDTNNTQLQIQATDGINCESEDYGSESICYSLRYLLVAKQYSNIEGGLDDSTTRKTLICNLPN